MTRTRRRTLLALPLALLLTGLATAYDVGERVQPFQAQDETGKVQRLADHQGHVVVLVFWGSNCQGSQAYAKRLEALRRKYAAQGVVFLAVASNSYETAETVKKAKGEQGLGWPVLLDSDHSLQKAFKAKVTPDAYVIDGQGVLRYRGLIDDDPRGARPQQAQRYLEDAIGALLAGRSPPAATTPRGVRIQ